MARLPWYAFLYRAFGAQGTFWLWILCLIAMWWTAKPTLHRLMNQSPAKTQVRAVAEKHSAIDLTRWVRLEGVEVVYDHELLGKDQADGHPPMRLLLDPDDPAARWWIEMRDLADAMASTADVGSAAQARRLFTDRYTLLAGDKDGDKVSAKLPEPGRALVVLNGPPPPRMLPPKPTDLSAFLDWLPKLTEARAALVRDRVRAVSVEGLLAPMPETLADRAKHQFQVTVGHWVLQPGKTPRALESYIFGVAAITLLFLATGFYGAVRAQRAQVEPV